MPNRIKQFLHNCVRFYVNALLQFGEWALTFRAIQWIATNRVHVIIGCYFCWIFISEFFTPGSPEQQDFYFVGLAVYLLMEYVLKTYRILRTDSFASLLAVLFFIPFLVYEFYRQIDYEYEAFYFIWPFLFDVGVFFGAIIVYVALSKKHRN